MTAARMNATRIEAFVVIQSNPAEPATAILEQWLDSRGHHVRQAATAEAAIACCAGGATDLLVLSLIDPADQSAAIDRIGLMPAAARPKHVAILGDDEPDLALRRRLPGVKFHLLGQPIHTLGLLDVVRRITAGI